MNKRDYYEILGLSRTADVEEINKAFRTQAIKLHPDQNQDDPNANTKFHELKEAYDILKDREKRNQYDQFGHQASSTNFNLYQHYNTTSFDNVFHGLEGIFEGLFGVGATTTRMKDKKQKGSDIKYYVNVKLEDVITGKNVVIKFTRDELCSTCNGTGCKTGTSKLKCSKCGGSGKVYFDDGFIRFASICSKCKGKGVIISHPCRKCKGKCIKPTDASVEVNIPKGVVSGTKLLVPGSGNASSDRGIKGNLIIIINVEPHPLFKRDNNSLHSELSISFLHAILGHEVKLNILGKQVKVKIPAGTQHNDIIRLKGCGLESNNNSNTGDLYIKICVVVPTKLSNQQQRLLQEFAILRGENIVTKPQTLYERLRKLKKRSS